jgi:hypothetical protein
MQYSSIDSFRARTNFSVPQTQTFRGNTQVIQAAQMQQPIGDSLHLTLKAPSKALHFGQDRDEQSGNAQQDDQDKPWWKSKTAKRTMKAAGLITAGVGGAATLIKTGFELEDKHHERKERREERIRKSKEGSSSGPYRLSQDQKDRLIFQGMVRSRAYADSYTGGESFDHEFENGMFRSETARRENGPKVEAMEAYWNDIKAGRVHLDLPRRIFEDLQDEMAHDMRTTGAYHVKRIAQRKLIEAGGVDHEGIGQLDPDQVVDDHLAVITAPRRRYLDYDQNQGY